MNLNFFKKAVLVTAVVNIVAGTSALLAMDLHMNLFYGRVTFDPVLKFYHYNLWFAILLMGFGYYYLSLSPVENKAIALIGGLMKLMVVGTWIFLFQLGEAKIIVLGPILFDLFYGILLCYFYYLHRGSTIQSAN